MKLISFEQIKALDITPEQSYTWIDFVLRNRDKFVMPTKVRIPLEGSDSCNIMPCAFPEQRVFELKVINRSENRREKGELNLDSQILLYDYDTANLLAIMDGNYITALRTAAVAAHSVMNFAPRFYTLAMLGLGNIGVATGDILFGLIKERSITVKLLEYKNQAERFADRFSCYKNIKFKFVDDYNELMYGSDVIISAVTYAENDFCDPSVYKPGVTVIPVHMRGFMECDLVFDHVIVSDMIRAQGFKYFERYKKITLTDDILEGNVPVREKSTDRVLVYNLGLAITDLFFASQIYTMVDGTRVRELSPKDIFYV